MVSFRLEPQNKYLYAALVAAILTTQQTIIETNFNFEPGAMNQHSFFVYKWLSRFLRFG